MDFTDPEAVKVLNRALLKHFYGVGYWDIPSGYLCAPIPGRADYIHNTADLLASDNAQAGAEGKAVRVLDIGVGANCIYPLIGAQTYGWTFVGSDIDPAALRSARQIVAANGLEKRIAIRKQPSAGHIFQGVFHPAEYFDLTICNPPFYSSMQEANAASNRKWVKLGQKKAVGTRNFGGTRHELWCEGGEGRFLTRMITESLEFGDRCRWFTALVSDKANLDRCYKVLARADAADIRTITMSQGQKVSRLLGWSFLTAPERIEFRTRLRANR